MRLVDCLERADISWCAIGGVAVNHWAKELMVTQDVDPVIVAESIDLAIQILEKASFRNKRFLWSIDFQGTSMLSI